MIDDRNLRYHDLVDRFFPREIIGDYSLDKIRAACAYFGNPQDVFQSVHIAGTNGKGSVSKMMFQMLKESGKKVGVYTSPHLIDICERFETNDGLISQADFIIYAERIIAYGQGLSYYERCTLLAFLYFRDQGCEYAVIEVGMGGRLDATNVITPILSIITSISYDHMEFLGDTLEQIASEKGGIIKPGIPVILYGKNPTLEQIAGERSSRVIPPQVRKLSTNLLGEHQLSNARIAYEAGIWLDIPEGMIQQALLHVEHRGRLQYLTPNLLIDGAHNLDGMRRLREYLDRESREVIYCVNLKSGKSVSLLLEVFEDINDWIIVESDSFRVTDAHILQSEFDSYHQRTRILTPSEILSGAQRDPDRLYVVFGSLYMIGDFYTLQKATFSL